MVTEIAPGIVLHDAALREICERHQIRELSIFGSAARREMRRDSDVDLLVEFLPGESIVPFRHFAAERELTALLGRKVDLVSKRALRPRVRDEVLPQARLVYEA